MAALSVLRPHILPLVRGCDADTADFHIRQAAIEFCRRTQSWRQEIPITPIADTEAYLIPMPTDAMASMLLDFDVLDVNGNSCQSYEVVATNRGRRLQRNDRCGAWVFLSDDGLTLNVQPTPQSTDGQLVPYLSLKPTQTAATLPDYLVNDHANAIAAGALARLLALPKVAWSDMGGAAVARTQFLADCGDSAVRASRGNARSQTRSRGQFY